MNTEQLKQIIYDEACNYFGLNLRKRDRRRKYVIPRQCVMNYLLSLDTGKKNSYGTSEVGKLFHLDHSTVTHARNCHDNAVDTNDKIYLTIWNKFKAHMNKFLVETTQHRPSNIYILELTDEGAIQKARDLHRSGGLVQYLEHQLIAL